MLEVYNCALTYVLGELVSNLASIAGMHYVVHNGVMASILSC